MSRRPNRGIVDWLMIATLAIVVSYLGYRVYRHFHNRAVETGCSVMAWASATESKDLRIAGAVYTACFKDRSWQ